MKRKVIKQGNGTLTITLPKGWTERIGLKGGDEIEIIEKGNYLNVSIEGKKTKRSTSLDVSSLKSERALKWLLSGLHKRGFDEIELIFDNPKTLQQIQKNLKNFYTGFAIMEQSSKRVVLRAISKDAYSELEPSLRRAFLVTFSLAEAILERIETGQFQNISELTILEMSNNQFTNFCERLLIKEGYSEPEKTPFKYLMAWNIEKVCDCYKDLCEYIEKQNISDISPEIISLYKDTLTFFRSFYDFIYRFKLESYNKIHQDEEKIKARLESFNPKKKHEIDIKYILLNIAERIMNFSGPTVLLNI